MVSEDKKRDRESERPAQKKWICVEKLVPYVWKLATRLELVQWHVLLHHVRNTDDNFKSAYKERYSDPIRQLLMGLKDKTDKVIKLIGYPTYALPFAQLRVAPRS